MMIGVVLIWFSCVMFVHLGLGQTICDLVRKDITVLTCQKCLSFQVVLAYTFIFTHYSVEWCFAMAFMASYLALWADLLLYKIARLYEKLYD